MLSELPIELVNNIATQPNGCWEWTGTRTQDGYGRFHWQGKRTYAHRLVYRLLVGEQPSGTVTDHLCRNPACVNPAHLENVTNKVNLLRGQGITAINSTKTHCIKGHPFSGWNLYVRRNGQRACRTCFNTRRQLRYRRRKELRAHLGAEATRSAPSSRPTE